MSPERRSTTDTQSLSLLQAQWVLCEVAEIVDGDPGDGLYHCVRMVPENGSLSTDWRETTTTIRFCGWWTKAQPTLAVGNRVWIWEYEGRNLIMLAEC